MGNRLSVVKSTIKHKLDKFEKELNPKEEKSLDITKPEFGCKILLLGAP